MREFKSCQRYLNTLVLDKFQVCINWIISAKNEYGWGKMSPTFTFYNKGIGEYCKIYFYPSIAIIFPSFQDRLIKRLYQVENVHNINFFSAKRPVPGSWESFAFMGVWIIKEQYKLYLIAIYNYFTILAKGFPLINGKMFQYKTWFTAFLVLNALKMKIKSRFQAQRCWKQAHFNTSHQNRIIQELQCKTLAGVL